MKIEVNKKQCCARDKVDNVVLRRSSVPRICVHVATSFPKFFISDTPHDAVKSKCGKRVFWVRGKLKPVKYRCL